MIVEAYEELKRKRINQWPSNSNRASVLGHECERYLVFKRTRWQEEKLHGPKLQGIFDLGNVLEAAVLRDLAEAGVKVVEQQRAFSWPEHLITGHIDAKVLVNGSAMPIEIKTSSPYVWQSLNTLDDMKRGRYPYLRRYPAQMMLYLLMDNKETGLFLFLNKLTGELKEIPCPLDYQLGESLIQKADSINAHVASGTVPPCIEYDEMTCGECGFLAICLPEVKRNAIEFSDDSDLLVDLKRRYELAGAKSEFDRLDKSIKERVSSHEKLVVGEFLITTKMQSRKAYTVEASEYKVTKIQLLGEKKGDLQ